jgi:hypothetical protein
MRFFSLVPLFLLSILTSCAVIGDRTVQITEAQIQEKLNEKLSVPFSLLKIFDVNLSNASVKFDAQTGRMQTSFDTNLASPFLKETLAGKLAISGKLRFDAASQSVVLDAPKVENVEIQGLAGKESEFVSAFAKNVGEKMLEGMVLYKVKPEDLKFGGTNYSPKNMVVTDKGLQLTLTPQR